MLALITNDDGVTSTGIRVLASCAEQSGLEVLVAAPSWDSSGASASLTAVESDGRLLVDETELEGVQGRCVSLEAAPAFIVRSAMSGAFGRVPDVVLSGVNHGPNTGHAVLHSGTVGASLTAATHDVPTIAFSLDTRGHGTNWATVADVVRAVLSGSRWDRHPGLALNVNIPDVPRAQLRGLEQARLAPFGAVTVNVTETGAGYVSLRYSEPQERAAADTDVALLRDGHATVTVLEPLGERRTELDLRALDGVLGHLGTD
ncbi:MAG: 5'/3'-nucleotidase SurE [Actinomycetota bacterium]|nr:5'/3'-nucleotidase SurE [Actinomycetota bacterium]